MRFFLGFFVVAVLTGGALLHNRNEKAAPPTPTAEASAQPATSVEPSKHNWPKRALDRAADLKSQIAEQRKGNEG